MDKYTRIELFSKGDKPLKLFVRYEGNKTFCKISCHDPLPIKGEFEIPSLNGLKNLLIKNGWVYNGMKE